MKHLLLCNSKQQVIAEGNPYLKVNCILVRSVERLNAQMLLNPFEETFHLPMSSIKFCNSKVRMPKIDAQETIDISCNIILIHNHAECICIPFGFLPCQSESGITNNSGTFINWMFFYYLILRVIFVPRNDDYLPTMKVVEQVLEILHMTIIHKVIIIWLNGYQDHRFSIMDCSFYQINKCGNSSSEIQQATHLYTVFIIMKARSWIELQAKFNCTTAEITHDTLYIESGRLILIQISRPGNKYLPEGMIDPRVFTFVYMCESQAMDISDFERIQLGGKRNQRCINTAETILIGELRKTPHHKLISAFKLDDMSITIVSLCTHLSRSYLGMRTLMKQRQFFP